MATFKKTEIVDGRQFTGGEQNGTDLTLWVQSGGDIQTATWLSAWRKAPEAIHLTKKNGYEFDRVLVGDWIIRRQSGEFIRVRPEELEADGYEIQ